MDNSQHQGYVNFIENLLKCYTEEKTLNLWQKNQDLISSSLIQLMLRKVEALPDLR